MRFLISFFTFLFLLGCYYLYGFVFVPMVIPENTESANRWLGGNVPRDMLEPYQFLFPEDAWERDPEVALEFLQLGDTIVLFQKDEITDNTAILRPCTILMISGEDDPTLSDEERALRRREAIVMRTPGQAELEFDGPLNLGEMPLPNLKQGRLNGKVAIWSDMQEAGTQDDLQLETEYVSFTDNPTRTEISTRYDVRFRLGNHTGEGRALSLIMAAANAKQPKELNQVSFETLKRLDMIFSDENAPSAAVAMPEKKVASLAQAPPPLPPSPEEFSYTIPMRDSDTRLEVTCQQKFTFRPFGKPKTPAPASGWEAVFQGNVTMRRHNPDGQTDQITGEIVTVRFADMPTQSGGKSPVATNAKTSDEKPLGSLEPILFVARGSDPVGNQSSKQARLISPQNGGIDAVGDEIMYDMIGKQIEIKTNGKPEPVRLVLQNQFRANSSTGFKYLFDQLETFGALESLGYGKGTLSGTTGEGEAKKNYAFNWGRLEIRRADPKVTKADHPDAVRLHVKLFGGIDANVEGFGKMKADKLDLWCDMLPATSSTTSESSPLKNTATPVGATPFGTKSQCVLVNAQIVAKGSERVSFQGLDGSTCHVSQMLIEFLRGNDGSTALGKRDPSFEALSLYSGTSGAAYPIQQVRYNASTPISRDALTPLNSVTPSAPITPAALKPPAKQKTQHSLLGLPSNQSGKNGDVFYRVSADVMTLYVNDKANNAQKGMETQGILLNHHVRIGESSLPTDPLGQELITAEKLTILHPSAPDMVVIIDGAPESPARFHGQGGILSSASVRIDRAQNSILSESGGKLTMPIRASSQGSVGTVANAAGGQATELQVHWNKRMFFHDDHITFEGQQDKSGGRVTVLHGENQRLLCDTLSIELDRVVSLFDSPPDLPSPTAKSFNCSGNVIVDDQQKAEDGSLKAILNGKFSAMTFFPATQYLIAEGDGEMRATFRDSAQHDSPAAGMMPRQNANTSNKEGLNYAYISFRDQMKGYLLTEQKNIDLYGDIQGLFVPVQTWQDQFNMVTYNRALRQGGVLLDCEHMQVIQTPNPPNPQGSLAVAANENASVEGETFFGKARSIKYNQAKQSVMFDGNASLTSHENGTHAAESFVYNVETGAIELIRLRSTTFGQ